MLHNPEQLEASDEAPRVRAGVLGIVAMIGMHLAAALLMFTMVAMSVNAVLRYGFDTNLHIITELSGFAFLFMIFLGAAGTFLVGGHISVELVVGQLPGRLRLIVRDILMGLVGIGYVGLLIWAGSEATWQFFKTGAASSGTTPIPYWIVLAIMPLGAGLLLLAQITGVVTALRKLTGGKGDRP